LIIHPVSAGLKIPWAFAEGTPIGIFPAGEVSTYKIETQQVTDRKWHPVVGKIIAKAKVPVVPIYFHGNNGLLFNLLSMIHQVYAQLNSHPNCLTSRGILLSCALANLLI
jgi:putative hemolysin